MTTEGSDETKQADREIIERMRHWLRQDDDGVDGSANAVEANANSFARAALREIDGLTVERDRLRVACEGVPELLDFGAWCAKEAAKSELATDMQTKAAAIRAAQAGADR